VLGLAAATKLTAISFVLMPLIAHTLAARDRGIRPLVILVASALVACLLAAPYYLLALPELWSAVVEQSGELGGSPLLYTLQFKGSTPYVFELTNLTWWGFGPPLGFAALGGWVWAIARTMAKRTAPWLLLTVWPTLYLLLIGTWQARFVRHTLPLLPFCCLFAAGGALALARWAWGTWGSRHHEAGGAVRGRRVRTLAAVLPAALAVGAVAWGLAFLAIYTSPDTRLAATGWIEANLHPATRLVVEDKNDLVPVPTAGRSVSGYNISVLLVTAPDSEQKMNAFADTLAHAEVLVVPNRRWSAVLPRLPDYPLTARYYKMLFGGDLGYVPLATFSSPPRLGPLSWPDDAAEETFQVFDHPTVRLFRNTAHLPARVLRGLLIGGLNVKRRGVGGQGSGVGP
jgi:hypothetical protein